MRKFKSIVIVYWILVVAGVAGGFLMLTGWSYPLKQVSKPLAKCKSVHRDKMPEGCAMDLPKIKQGDSSLYKSDETYRLIYSDLWGGTYDNGWDVDAGSSPGVDIVSSKGTPVYAIGDGTIVQAGYKRGIGNSITIKHPYKGSFIYSSYSHLDEMYFEVGDTVKEGVLIGKVGNSGVTYGQYGNHLDFQLTTTTQWFYPYSYHDCNVGLSYYDIINSAVCRSYMIANTIDPILFLETNGAGSPIDKLVEKKSKSTRTTTKQTELSMVVKNTDPVHEVALVSIPTPQAVTTSSAKKYQYQVIGLQQKETIQIKRKFVFFIKVYDVDTKSIYDGKLDHRIVIRDSQGIIAFDRPVITSVSKGIAKVTALGLKSGYTDLQVEIAGKILGTYGITLQ